MRTYKFNSRLSHQGPAQLRSHSEPQRGSALLAVAPIGQGNAREGELLHRERERDRGKERV